MPKDRSDDRHRAKGRLIRPMPPELWTRLGEKVGERKRNEAISELIRMLVDGEIELNSEKAPPAEADGTSER